MTAKAAAKTSAAGNFGFPDDVVAALRSEYATKATAEQVTLWLDFCARHQLEPQRDVVLQVRNTSEWDDEVRQKVFRKRAIYISTIGCLRKQAERTGKYDGQLPSVWLYLDNAGEPKIESLVPLPEKDNTQVPREPWAVRVGVKRKDFSEPITAVARFRAFCQTNRDGNLNATWSMTGRGPEQLEKCGLAAALRAAFPDENAGLYLAEEIKDEETATAAGAHANPSPVTVQPPAATPIPAVNHTPATAGDEPRPQRKPAVPEATTSLSPSGAAPGEVTATPAEPSPMTAVTSPSPDPCGEQAKKSMEPLRDVESTVATNLSAAPLDSGLANSQQPTAAPASDEFRNTVVTPKIRSYQKNGVATPTLKAYVLARARTDDTKKLSAAQWREIFATLDALNAKGLGELNKFLDAAVQAAA